MQLVEVALRNATERASCDANLSRAVSPASDLLPLAKSAQEVRTLAAQYGVDPGVLKGLHNLLIATYHCAKASPREAGTRAFIYLILSCADADDESEPVVRGDSLQQPNGLQMV
eukprot:5666141-Pleurochrysis_carterae.AAC.2